MITSHLTFTDMVDDGGSAHSTDSEAMGGKVSFRPANRGAIGDEWMKCGQFECDGT